MTKNSERIKKRFNSEDMDIMRESMLRIYGNAYEKHHLKRIVGSSVAHYAPFKQKLYGNYNDGEFYAGMITAILRILTTCDSGYIQAHNDIGPHLCPFFTGPKSAYSTVIDATLKPGESVFLPNGGTLSHQEESMKLPPPEQFKAMLDSLSNYHLTLEIEKFERLNRRKIKSSDINGPSSAPLQDKRELSPARQKARIIMDLEDRLFFQTCSIIQEQITPEPRFSGTVSAPYSSQRDGSSITLYYPQLPNKDVIFDAFITSMPPSHFSKEVIPSGTIVEEFNSTSQGYNTPLETPVCAITFDATMDEMKKIIHKLEMRHTLSQIRGGR